MTGVSDRLPELPSAEELASRAQAGSSAAFNALVARYDERLLRFLRRRTPRPQDAEDLRQETFLRAYQNIERYDPTRPFGAWLFTIASRLAVSHARRQTAQPPPAAGPEQAAAQPMPDEAAAQREAADNCCLASFHRASAAQYAAVWLRYAEGLTAQEAARRLGKSRVHVRVLLHRARQKLIAACPPGGKWAGQTD